MKLNMKSITTIMMNAYILIATSIVAHTKTYGLPLEKTPKPPSRLILTSGRLIWGWRNEDLNYSKCTCPTSYLSMLE